MFNKRVTAALSDASIMFAYEGTMEEPDDLWEPTNWMPLFHNALSEEEQQAVTKSLKQHELPIDALLKVATSAPFDGDGEAVFDTKFCNAFEIPESQLPEALLEVLDFDSDSVWAMEQLKMAMKPSSKKWTSRLHSIKMYGPGVKFGDHVDALHQSNHVATVVLSLPAKHVGGILRIQHLGEAMEFNSAKRPKKDMYYGTTHFRYGAFLTHCSQAMKEVISGWRVVVQYDVYEDGGADHNQDEDYNIEDEESDRNEKYKARLLDSHFGENKFSVGMSNILKNNQTELVQAVSQYMAKMPPTQQGVAFLLRHRYFLSALDEVRVLKGVDRMIYDAFSKREDLSISIRGLLVYVKNWDYNPVSYKVTSISMNDLLPKLSASYDVFDDELFDDDDNLPSTHRCMATEANTEKREIATSEKCTVRLIVDEKNGSMLVYSPDECLHGCDCWGEWVSGEDPPSGHNTYYVSCMIIRSLEK
jgi:hypothetical protein